MTDTQGLIILFPLLLCMLSNVHTRNLDERNWGEIGDCQYGQLWGGGMGSKEGAVKWVLAGGGTL